MYLYNNKSINNKYYCNKIYKLLFIIVVVFELFIILIYKNFVDFSFNNET